MVYPLNNETEVYLSLILRSRGGFHQFQNVPPGGAVVIHPEVRKKNSFCQ